MTKNEGEAMRYKVKGFMVVVLWTSDLPAPFLILHDTALSITFIAWEGWMLLPDQCPDRNFQSLEQGERERDEIRKAHASISFQFQ